MSAYLVYLFKISTFSRSMCMYIFLKRSFNSINTNTISDYLTWSVNEHSKYNTALDFNK